MTARERATHQALSLRLFGEVQDRKELPNRYVFRPPAGALTSAAEWVALERKCCPFFDFELDLARNAGPLWLRITGAEGIKPFIRAEFALDEVPRQQAGLSTPHPPTPLPRRGGPGGRGERLGSGAPDDPPDPKARRGKLTKAGPNRAPPPG